MTREHVLWYTNTFRMRQISSIRMQLLEMAQTSAESTAAKWEKAKTNVVVAKLLAVWADAVAVLEDADDVRRLLEVRPVS